MSVCNETAKYGQWTPPLLWRLFSFGPVLEMAFKLKVYTCMREKAW